jgi:hypothetical protein
VAIEVEDMDAVPVHGLPVATGWGQLGLEPGGLDDSVASTRSCGSVQEPLPRPLTYALWAITAGNLLVGGWAAAVLTGALSCSGFLCTLATLGDRPLLLLILTCNCVAAMLGAATVTGGLTKAGGAQWGVLVTTAVVGACTVLGVVLALLLVAAAITLIGGVFIAVIERM